MSPGADVTARVLMVPFQEGVYDADTGPIPPFDSRLSGQFGILTMVILTVASDDTARELIGDTYRVGILVEVRPIYETRAVIEVEIRPHDTEELFMPADVKNLSPTSVLIGNVEKGLAYDLRLRWAISGGKVGAWVEHLNHVVGTRQTEAPTNFSLSIVEGGQRQYTWNIPTTPDNAGFLIRYGNAANMDWDDMTPLHGGLLTSLAYLAVEPGIGSFWFGLRAQSTGGILSDIVRIGPYDLGEIISGQRWLFGTGAPAAALGRDDDLYLDTNSHQVWRKLSGTWSLAADFAGQDGQGTEDIFASSADGAIITGSANLPDSNWNFDLPGLATANGVTRGNQTYYDGTPPDLSEARPFVIQFTRPVTGSPAVNENIGNVPWVQQSPVRLWGREGLTPEYVFTSSTNGAAITNSADLPDPDWNFDIPGLATGVTRGAYTYYDGAPGDLSESRPFIIRFRRYIRPLGAALLAIGDDVGNVPWLQEAAVRAWGVRGFRGPRGFDGRDGHDGHDGHDGAKGDKGDKGDKGEKGDKGDPAQLGTANVQTHHIALSATASVYATVLGNSGGSITVPGGSGYRYLAWCSGIMWRTGANTGTVRLRRGNTTLASRTEGLDVDKNEGSDISLASSGSHSSQRTFSVTRTSGASLQGLLCIYVAKR